MKGYFLVFAFLLVMVVSSFASDQFGQEMEDEQPLLQRFKRESCDNIDEYRECDRFCRRLGLPGGACVRNKCDCDRF